MVYKLVDLNGASKIKLSEDKIKVLIPGKKNLFRVYEGDVPSFDVLLHFDEEDLKEGPMTVYNPFTEEEFKKTSTKVVKISQVLFDKGQDLFGINKPLNERRKFVLDQIEHFDKEVVIEDTKKFPLFSS